MNQRGPRTIPTLLITGAALAAASGCGTQISPGTGDDGTSSTTSTALIAPGAELIAPGTELVGVGTVLEQGAAGAQLCLGATRIRCHRSAAALPSPGGIGPRRRARRRRTGSGGARMP